MGATTIGFPGGFASPGFPALLGSGFFGFGVGGKTWWVNSAKGQDSHGKGLTKDAPFKTLAYAFSSAAPKSGDLIVVAEGHTENITAAAGINANIAGVTVLGLGTHTTRPSFTFTTIASATFAFAAANIAVINCRFNGTGVASVVKMFNVTAAGCSLQGCYIVVANATQQALNCITLSAGGDTFTVARCEVDANTAGAATFIVSVAAAVRLTVVDSNIYGNWSTAIFSSTSTFHITNMFLSRNRLRQANGTAKVIFNFTTSSTGVVSYNTLEGTTWATAADAIANSTSTSLRWFENYGFDDGAGAVSGVLVPAAGTIA